MSAAPTTAVAGAAKPAIGFVERYLTSWVALCIITGIVLGRMLLGATLASVVGVLIEVPVMLLLVGIVNRSKHWYESKI